MAVSPSLAATILEELRAEHAQVLLPLVAKLKMIADQIDANVAVPAEVLRAGLELWGRYSTELRAETVHRLLNPLSATGGPGECGRRLRELTEEGSVEKARIPNLERLLKTYAAGQFGGRPIFLGTLVSSIEAGRVWARYEEEYASHCLVQNPPPTVEASVRQWLEQARAIRERLSAEVRSYVAMPAVPVPAAAPS